MQSLGMSGGHFTFFRIALGGYLFLHFLQLIPYAGELFSAAGVLGDSRLNFTHGLLPNPLEHGGSPQFAEGMILALAVLSLCFAFGFYRRISALLLWYGWACLFNRNNLISNPGIPYIGLLLLLCVVVPGKEPLSFGKHRHDFYMPPIAYWGMWVLLMAGYTYSGVWKLFSPSWIDGSALHHLLTNPLAHPNIFRDLLLRLPPECLQVLTWTALIGELLALPLIWSRTGRLIAWSWMLLMHAGILMVVDFADLTFGMIMAHLFTFEPKWVPAARTADALVLFDGDCAFCNRAVQFLMKRDKTHVLRFAPLSGSTAAAIGARHKVNLSGLQTMVLVESYDTAEERLSFRSTAFFRILRRLGGIWGVLSAFRFIPPFISDAVYNFIAKHRYAISGSAKCELPMPGASQWLLP